MTTSSILLTLNSLINIHEACADIVSDERLPVRTYTVTYSFRTSNEKVVPFVTLRLPLDIPELLACAEKQQSISFKAEEVDIFVESCHLTTLAFLDIYSQRPTDYAELARQFMEKRGHVVLRNRFSV